MAALMGQELQTPANIGRLGAAFTAMMLRHDMGIATAAGTNTVENGFSVSAIRAGLTAHAEATASAPVPARVAEPASCAAEEREEVSARRRLAAPTVVEEVDEGTAPRRPAAGARRGQARDRESTALTLAALDRASAEVDAARSFVHTASDGVTVREIMGLPRPPSPTTQANRTQLERAEAHREAVRDQDCMTRFRAARELVEAQETYEARLDLRREQIAAARAADYVVEHPGQAAAIVAGTGLMVASAVVTAPVAVTVGLGGAGGGLVSLASNDFKLETREDVLTVGSGALMGACAPLRPVVSGVAGLGIGAVGYATDSTPMMVDGGLLVAPAAVRGVGGAVRSLGAARAPASEAASTAVRQVANRNVVTMEAVAQQMQRPANQNVARVFEQPLRATGTDGLPLTVRMSEGGSGGSRGFSGVGRSDALGASSGSATASGARSGRGGGAPTASRPAAPTAPRPTAVPTSASRTAAPTIASPFRITDANAHPSLPVGSRAARPTPSFQTPNTPTIINGRQFTDHALDEMRAQGIMPSVVEETIRSGQSFPGRNLGRTVFYDSRNNISVVLEVDGTVVTSSPGRLYGVR